MFQIKSLRMNHNFAFWTSAANSGGARPKARFFKIGFQQNVLNVNIYLFLEAEFYFRPI